jgi:hypothetical protein
MTHSSLFIFGRLCSKESCFFFNVVTILLLDLYLSGSERRQCPVLPFVFKNAMVSVRNSILNDIVFVVMAD